MTQVLHANLGAESSVNTICKIASGKILSLPGKNLAVHLDDQCLLPLFPFGKDKPKDVIIFFRQQFRRFIEWSDNQSKPVGLNEFFREKRFCFIKVLHLQLLKKQIAKDLYCAVVRGWRPDIMRRPAFPVQHALVDYYGFRSHIDTPILYRISRLLSKF